MCRSKAEGHLVILQNATVWLSLSTTVKVDTSKVNERALLSPKIPTRGKKITITIPLQ